MQIKAGTTNIRNTFPKRLRLSSHKLVGELFRHSLFISAPALKLFYTYTILPGGETLQILITVPKKNFSKASDRNRIKRLIRESVRHHLHPLFLSLKSSQQSMALGLMYTGKSLPSYSVISVYIQQLFSRLLKIHESHPTVSVQPDDSHCKDLSGSAFPHAGTE